MRDGVPLKSKQKEVSGKGGSHSKQHGTGSAQQTGSGLWAACQALEHASGVDELEKLSKRFAALNGYKDWSEKIKHRKETAQMLLRKKEKAAQQKTRKIFAITGTVAVLAVVLFMLVTKVIIPPIRYNEATELFTNGDYAGAEIAFEALGDFKDSAEKVSEVKYAAAMEQFTSGDYAGAEAAFEALGSFGDSAKKCKEARYAVAETKYAAEKYPEAAMMFFNAGDYKDSKGRYIEAGQKAGMHQTVSAGGHHTVGLKSDGTVVATKYSGYYCGQCRKVLHCGSEIGRHRGRRRSEWLWSM